jgi:hypothetical protein
LSADRVPDPEELVDLRLVVLQAVAWTTRSGKASFGETGLKAAIAGAEVLANGSPINQALLDLPQFGAARYLRAKDRRIDETIAELIGAGAIVRVTVEHLARIYQTLKLTEIGQSLLGRRDGNR